MSRGRMSGQQWRDKMEYSGGFDHPSPPAEPKCECGHEVGQHTPNFGCAVILRKPPCPCTAYRPPATEPAESGEDKSAHIENSSVNESKEAFTEAEKKYLKRIFTPTAEELEMDFFLDENRQIKGGLYDNVVLSRLTVRHSQNFDITINLEKFQACFY